MKVLKAILTIAAIQIFLALFALATKYNSFIPHNKISATSSTVDDAIAMCKAARERNPKNDQQVKGPSFCLGQLLERKNDIEGAIQAYLTSIKHCPQNGQALFNLASIYEGKVMLEEAAVIFQRCCAITLVRTDSIQKLIPILLKLGKDDEALQLCLSHLRDNPDCIKVKELLGAVYHKAGRFGDAFKVYLDILQSESMSLKAILNAALAADCAGNFREAERFYKMALADLGSNDANTWTNWGCFLKYHGREAEAVEALMKAIALDPAENQSETGYAIVQLASLTGGLKTAKMSTSYVTALFNGYAERFDDELCGMLGYRGHEHAARQVRIMANQLNRADLRIVDLGCGTGLVGSLINDFKRELIGVDLSENMLLKAKQRGYDVYDKLVLSDAVTYLRDFREEFPEACIDVIVAADVFIYIGNLDTIFYEAALSLAKPNGQLIFTVEELEEPRSVGSGISEKRIATPNNIELEAFQSYELGPKEESRFITEFMEGIEGVRLLACGRFGHSERYIRALAANHGFKVLYCTRETLRTQAGRPVKSITFSLALA